MDLIFSGLLMGGVVLLIGLLVNKFDAARGETAPSLPPKGATADLSADPQPRLPSADTGIVEVGDGPFRRSNAFEALDRLLLTTEEQRWRWLMAAAHRKTDHDAFREMSVADSLSFDFLFGKCLEGKCKDVVGFVFAKRHRMPAVDDRVARMDRHMIVLYLYDLVKEVDRSEVENDVDRIVERIMNERAFSFRPFDLFRAIGGFTAMRGLCRLMEEGNFTVRSYARTIMVKSFGIGWTFVWLEYIINFGRDDMVRSEAMEEMVKHEGGKELLATIQDALAR